MGVVQVISDVADGSTTSSSTDSDTPAPWQRISQIGHNNQVDPAANPTTSIYARVGGWIGGSTGNPWVRVDFNAYFIFQVDDGFILPTGSDVADVHFRVTRQNFSYSDSNFNADNYIVYCQDWTPPLSSQWFNLFAQLGVNEGGGLWSDGDIKWMLMDRSAGAGLGGDGAGVYFITGGEVIRSTVKTKLATGNPFGLVMIAQSATVPYPEGYQNFHLQDITTAHPLVTESNRPTLRVHTLKIHDLNYVLGASIQMTDGTAVMLRYDRATGKVGLWYQRLSQTTATKIGDLDTTSASTEYFDITKPAAQCLSLCRDDSNNIYVVGSSGRTASFRKITITAYKYNGSYSWTKQTTNVTDGDSGQPADKYHRGGINNVSAVWIPNPGGAAGGSLALQFSKRTAQWAYYETGTEIVNAGYYLGTAGVPKLAKFDHVVPLVWTGTVWQPFNSVGSQLDSLEVGTNKIITNSNCQPPAKSTKTRNGVHSFSITATSNAPTVPQFNSTTFVDQRHDADGKLRNVWMNSTTRYATFSGSNFVIRNVSDHSIVDQIDLTTMSITNYPSRDATDADAIWDVIFDNALNCFWFYYVDSQNQRHIRKVRYDHTTHVIYASIALTGSPLGASGSSIKALRVPRGKTDSRCVLVDAAMQDGANAPTTLITVRDLTMDVAPGAPILDPITTFSATTAHDFPYTVNDLNPGDTSTAHEVEIKRVTTGTTVYSSGKVTPTLVAGQKYKHTLPSSTLSNDTQYQIRIRNYDAVDTVGAWTAWTGFTTSATGGLVTIISPQYNNAPLNASQVTVTWVYSNTTGGITQNGYQVKVYNDATNALLSDSGIVASTATSRNVTGMSTDVQYRIEVQVRGTDGNLSGAGIILVFPDFDNPSTPVIDAVPGDGYIEVRVTNPPPTGENPVTVSNQIARKLTGAADSTYVVVGSCGLNGIFRDYGVASGKSYSYKARGSTT